MFIETSIPLLEEILGEWQQEIGNDFQAYKNHIYRVVHFCLMLHRSNEVEREKIIIAGCFHDLGIWTHHTFDYLQPSIELVRNYLKQAEKQSWFDEIVSMINFHHKITCTQNINYPLVEIFRQADWVDVSRGMLHFGLSKEQIESVKKNFRIQVFINGWFN